MNATSDCPRGPLTLLRATFAAAFIISISVLSQAKADPAFTVTDLGTLGGNTTTATSVIGHGMNASGMIVGSSTTADNSEHAFLYVGDKMYDLNNLCDLGQSGFKVLTIARTISDSCVIIGDGISSNGDKHAFRLTPVEVAGGQWHYECCQWIWKQTGGGWCWESNCGCYKWCGPPGKHPPCPPQPPPCWNWPLPCCPGCPPPVGPPPPPPPPPTYVPPPAPPPPTSGGCWCCIDGVVFYSDTGQCNPVVYSKPGSKRAASFSPCYPTKDEALKHCKPKSCWCCIDGKIVEVPADQCENDGPPTPVSKRSEGRRCYPTKEEAIIHCSPPINCWCCIDGNIVGTTPEKCEQRGGQCYNDWEEARRDPRCRGGKTPPPPPPPPEPPGCWCCYKGDIYYTTVSACQEGGGQCYPTREEAKKHCAPPPDCWCCVTGAAGVTAILTTEEVCRQRGEQCYATKEEALKHCSLKPTPTPSPELPQCWCCINGQIVHTTVGDCQERGGQCYATEAVAKRRCKGGTTPTPTPSYTTTKPPATPTPTATPKIPRRRHSPTPTPGANASATPRGKHSRTQLTTREEESTRTTREQKSKSKGKSPTPSPVPRG